MEKSRVARAHFQMNAFVPLQGCLHVLRIGLQLAGLDPMLEPSQQMRALDHLEAAVLTSRLVDGDEAARHHRV